jgi:hypothetical protein
MISGTTIRGAICLAWLLLVGAGFAFVLNYEKTPGQSAQAPGFWPNESAIRRDSSRPELIVFAHPQCPCTRATIEELNRLLSRKEGKVNAQVWFYQPEDFTADWSYSDLWKTAAAIPGVSVMKDMGGREALRFGAQTSGTVYLYGTDGRLLFKGGITSGRGHEGENEGEETIARLLTGTRFDLRTTPVYGCSLLSCEVTGKP